MIPDKSNIKVLGKIFYIGSERRELCLCNLKLPAKHKTKSRRKAAGAKENMINNTVSA